jgi:hypothetical protein
VGFQLSNMLLVHGGILPKRVGRTLEAIAGHLNSEMRQPTGVIIEIGSAALTTDQSSRYFFSGTAVAKRPNFRL